MQRKKVGIFLIVSPLWIPSTAFVLVNIIGLVMGYSFGQIGAAFMDFYSFLFTTPQDPSKFERLFMSTPGTAFKVGYWLVNVYLVLLGILNLRQRRADAWNGQ